MLGFAENEDGKVCAVLAQPFIVDARLATKQEIHDESIIYPSDTGGYDKYRSLSPNFSLTL